MRHGSQVVDLVGANLGDELRREGGRGGREEEGKQWASMPDHAIEKVGGGVNREGGRQARREREGRRGKRGRQGEREGGRALPGSGLWSRSSRHSGERSVRPRRGGPCRGARCGVC